MLVLTQQKDQVYEITLNRPDKRNAMNHALMQALEAAIDEAEKCQGVRAVVIRGAGASFSAGIDLLGFSDMIEVFGENWQSNLFPMTAMYQRILGKFEASSLPTIAMLHGHCLGMAFELALACDFRIAAAETKLGLPETRLGLIPDVGGTARLTRMVGITRAKELILTGRTFTAQDAQDWGILNDVVSQDALQSRVDQLVTELAEAAPLAVSYAKRVINACDDLERGLQMEAWAQSILIRSEDFATGAQAMMTKQKPQWKGR
ncbi:MAG: enoyl-CoA hydratase [Phototrophicales bacterium]|nr:MAG: enoyl-CoA hydratase [Phototrophicales bacterium]